MHWKLKLESRVVLFQSQNGQYTLSSHHKDTLAKPVCSVTLVGFTGSGSLTRAVYERPIEALFFGAAAWLQGDVVGWTLLTRLHSSLHGASVGALHAQAFPRAAGVATPAALRLLQALGARLQPRAVLG